MLSRIPQKPARCLMEGDCTCKYLPRVKKVIIDLNYQKPENLSVYADFLNTPETQKNVRKWRIFRDPVILVYNPHIKKDYHRNVETLQRLAVNLPEKDNLGGDGGHYGIDEIGKRRNQCRPLPFDFSCTGSRNTHPWIPALISSQNSVEEVCQPRSNSSHRIWRYIFLKQMVRRLHQYLIQAGTNFLAFPFFLQLFTQAG